MAGRTFSAYSVLEIPISGGVMSAVPKNKVMNSGGFTLVELMVVVAIIAILTLVAFPAYQDQMRKTRRSDAKVALTELANRQEKFFSDNQRYTGTIVGSPGLAYTLSLSPERYYTLSAQAPSNTRYMLTATAIATGPQGADTRCLTMTLDQNGLKLPTSGCW
jgi:type IV pilus assembly protein PilE